MDEPVIEFHDPGRGLHIRSTQAPGSADAVSLFARLWQEREARETQWTAAMRSLGIAAWHPDDGWVDRTRETVRLVYPRFEDNPQPGDLIALGSSPGGVRLVRVTAVLESRSDRGSPLFAWEPWLSAPWTPEQGVAARAEAHPPGAPGTGPGPAVRFRAVMARAIRRPGAAGANRQGLL